MKIPCNFRDWNPLPQEMPLRAEERERGRGTRRKTEEEERKIMKRGVLTSFNFL